MAERRREDVFARARDRRQGAVTAEQAVYDSNPTAYTPPSDNFQLKNGKIGYNDTDPLTGLQKLFLTGAGTFAGVGAGTALAGLGGAAGASGAASGAAPAAGAAATETPALISTLSPSTLATVGGGAGTAAKAGSFMGGIGDWLKRIDPTNLALGGLSLFGGDGDERQSFKGSSADPIQTLTALLDAVKHLGGSISDRQPIQNVEIGKGPAPVSIPGLGFQIGGGMGLDPAIKAQGALTGPPPISNPFGQQGGQAQPRPTKRRSPGGK
jgi:hypothetical protein